MILLPDGSIVEASQFDWKEIAELGDFYRYESAGSRGAKQAPAHVKMMQQLENLLVTNLLLIQAILGGCQKDT